jgi:uncharacterized protein (TIGR02246 family)
MEKTVLNCLKIMTNIQNRNDDTNAIHHLLEHLTQAWNRQDAESYGAAFSQDARYIAFFGGIYRGRNEIIESHRALWEKTLKGTRMYYEVLEIRFVASDTAIVVTRGEVAKKEPKQLPKVQTYVATRQNDGQWLFDHFQNTKKSRFMQFLTYSLGPAATPSMDKR